MTNRGDQPALPVTLAPGEVWSETEDYANGMTIREDIAKAMAQGLVTAQNEDGEWNHDAQTIAQVAVEYADALLAELERTK